MINHISTQEVKQSKVTVRSLQSQHLLPSRSVSYAVSPVPFTPVIMRAATTALTAAWVKAGGL